MRSAARCAPTPRRSPAPSPRCSRRRPGSRSRRCSCCSTSGRCAASGRARRRPTPSRCPPRGGPASLRLLAEKLPFFAVAAAMMFVTSAFQAGNRVPLERLPIGDRLVHALVAYAWYVAKTLWPAQLSPHYPHPYLVGGGVPWTGAQIALAALLLAALTALAVRFARRGYPLVGWLWFLGTLVPVLGFVAARHPGHGRPLHASPAHRPVHRRGVRRLGAARPAAAKPARCGGSPRRRSWRCCSRSARRHSPDARVARHGIAVHACAARDAARCDDPAGGSRIVDLEAGRFDDALRTPRRR